MLRTQAIREFLKTTGNSHITNLYNSHMEVQVNVARDNGERITDVYMGKSWAGWKGPDGSIWKSFRIPWSADTDPQYTDKEMSFSLAQHTEGIGMTGWDWYNRQSIWVGFDFDSIANHKEGLPKEELNELVNIVSTVPWVTLIKSTSGHGYHIYIHFDEPVPTNTHTEHAALARSLLSVLTVETGINFQAKVDCCGSVLWVYHRKQEGTDGLSLLKQGSKLPNSKIPANWRDHISVTAKRTKKTAIKKELSELIASQQFITLDEEHDRLLKWFSTNAKLDFWWDSDHNMFVCHTLDLARAHAELSLRGIFFTNSSGSSTQNCFMFPTHNGSWNVRRHGIGTKEHPSWTTDPSGWTRCVFNAPAELESAIKTNKGIKNAKGEWVFYSHNEGFLALKQVGIDVENPFIGVDRMMIIKPKGDLLIVAVTKAATDQRPEGYLLSNKGDNWEIVLELPKNRRELTSPDTLVRHAISQGVEAGWFIKTKDDWILENKSNVLSVLTGQEEFDRLEIEIMMGKCILSPWKIVNYPFAEEYPGNREWNKDAASLIQPIEGDCTTWLNIVNHCGASLTDAVLQNEWCVSNGIRTGGDYLLCWLSSMFQKPTQPLPYLFFVGEQNTGKSTLHEALGAFVLRKGYSRADQALTNPSGFNAEIANSVLCVVEETDLRKNKEAGNRIKDWVTGKTISIRALYKNTYDIVNSTHWMQCANDSNYCPIIAGDTRIVVARVNKPEQEIPKQVLFGKLEEEAAAFLHLLYTVELPASNSRLAVPCIQTFEKVELEYDSKNELERFIDEHCCIRKGHKIPFADFYAQFLTWLPPDLRGLWSENQTSRKFPKVGILCKGKMGADSVTYIGNLTFDKEAKDKNVICKANSFTGRLEDIGT